MNLSNPKPLRVVIVGGGFAGTMVAVHLLRQAPAGALITVVERKPPLGRGIAYADNAGPYLLNVPVERMGAFPDERDGFLKWLRDRVGRTGYPSVVKEGDFVERRLYGEYIGFLLTSARQEAHPAVSFNVLPGEVVDIDEFSSGGGRLYLADGTTLAADHVVLALGNLPGEYPVRFCRQVYRGRRYIHTPWQSDAIEGIDSRADVVIAGQGLSAADVILKLVESEHRGTIYCLSRRGLHLLTHREGAVYHDFLADQPAPVTTLALFKRVRQEVRKAARSGVDWRAVLDALRPHAQRLWQALDWGERARFMRHLRPYWEVHRHRLPPAVAQRIGQLVCNGRVRCLAGSFRRLEETEEGLRVVWRPRGGEEDSELRVAKLINCTGPRTDYSKYQHPLFVNLLARGLIDHDPLALGLAATPDGRLLRYRGGAIPWLRTIGAPLKGVLWECTSVPEIRELAAHMARSILRGAWPHADPQPTRFQRLVEDAKNRIVEVDVATLTAELQEGGSLRLIDIREAEEVAQGKIAGALPLPRGVLEGRIEQLVSNEHDNIVLYCAGGNRSALAAASLQAMGYTRVRSLRGGYATWVSAIQPT